MRLWQGAGLRRDEDEARERVTGWLELFSDLVFVVIIARLAHGLVTHLDAHAALAFVLAFVGVFWVWNSFTYYGERFEGDGLDHRLLTVAGMVPVVGMAVWAESALDHGFVGFVVAYLAARAVNIAAWLRAGAHEPVFRGVAARFALGFAVVAAVLVVALVVENPTLRLLLWTIAVVIDVSTPVLTVRAQSTLPAISSSKFPERFGLLTMIVLGESVTGVVVGLSELQESGHLSALGLVQGLIGLLVGVALAWIYYDFVARRPPRGVFAVALAWVYLHLVVIVVIAAGGAGISRVIGASALGVDESAASRLLLVIAVAAAVVAIAALELTLAPDPDGAFHPVWGPGVKLAAAAVLLGLGLPDLGLGTTGLLGLVLLVLLVPVSYALRVWSRVGDAPTDVDTGADLADR